MLRIVKNVIDNQREIMAQFDTQDPYVVNYGPLP